MSLKKINSLWAVLGIIFFILWLFVKEKEFFLPIPEEKNIKKLEISFQNKNLKLEKKQGLWNIDKKHNLPELLEKLRNSCKGEFLAKDFDIKKDGEDLILNLNQGEKILEFSINNPVFGANILKIKDKIYLCPEFFKAKLIIIASEK